MANDNLKDFVIQWSIVGLLAFCLLGFTMNFMLENNPSALDSDGTSQIFQKYNSSLSGKLSVASADSNTLLNITANTNPEASDLGSRNSVAIAYNAAAGPSDYFQMTKLFLSWVFSGAIGKAILSVLGGMVAFSIAYYSYKFIKTGQ